MNFQDSQAIENKPDLLRGILLLIPVVALVLAFGIDSDSSSVSLKVSSANEVKIDPELIALFNSAETSSAYVLPRLLSKMDNLNELQIDILVKTALLRSLENPSLPYLRLLHKYRAPAFVFIKELSVNEDNLFSLLDIYGYLFIDFQNRGWSTVMDKEKKDFLFSKLLIGLDNDTDTYFDIRSFSLGLVNITADPDSVPFLRSLIQKETWLSNIDLASQMIREF